MRIESRPILNAKARLTASLLSLRNDMLKYVLFATIRGVKPRAQAKRIREMALRHLAKPIGFRGRQERMVVERMNRESKYGMDLPLVLLFSSISLDLYRELKKHPEADPMTKEGRRRRSEIAFDRLDGDLQETRTKGITDVARHFEAEIREVTSEDVLRINRRREVPEVFYLASWHGDCAEDHLDAQGKLYIDREWKTWVKDKEIRKEINIYVSKYQVGRLQSIMNRPTWLFTRPNCRHYFDSVPTSEVLSGKSWEEMLTDRDMKHEVGLRGMQNIFHSTEKGWYTRENVESIIRQYEERLEAHLAMFDADPDNATIRRAIAKDKALIRKWKGFLSRNW